MTKRMLLAAAAAVLVPLAASAGPMKSGKWRVTIDAGKGKRTIERCMTEQEANNTAPPKMKDATCKVVAMNLTNDLVSWKMSCPKSGMTIESKTTYAGDTFTGQTTFTDAKGKVISSQKTTGRYLGKCK